jgi:type VI secretion system protein ImpA
VIRQEWLQAVTPEAPCGPNVEYEQDFLDLEQAARGKLEQQYGDTVIPAEEPDWADVVARASSLLDRVRDVRVIVHLTRGLTKTQGLAGLRDGLSLVPELLENFWDALHPQLVVDGDSDPMLRLNALASFGDVSGLVRDVRQADFLKSPLGTFTVRDVEKILDPKAPASESPVTPDQLRSVIRDLIMADHGALSEATQGMAALDRARAALLKHFEPGQLPDFAPLRSVLKDLDHLTSPIRAEVLALSEASAAAVDGGAPGAPGAAAPVMVGVGEIRTRDDAIKALDKVCEYLARAEPTNPSPLIIRRAQRLMTMPFMDIIKDLAPDAAGQVQKITGTKDS